MSARHPSLKLLRERDFGLYLASRLASTTAMTMLQAAVAWQVYQISGSALQLGMLGLARFLPSLGMSLLGGAVADSFDRRRIVMLSQVVPLACSAVLYLATADDWISLPLIYGLVLLVAVASAFESPARQALIPSLVTTQEFPRAITIASTAQSLGFVTGPALAGAVIAARGLDASYAIHVALIAVSVVLLAGVRARARRVEGRAVSLAAIREGVQFVWQRQVLLGAMTLDMFAVVFGGASALLPIYATDILEVGPRGYGLLTASLELGALVMSLALVFLPPIQRVGRTLLLTVAAFGLGTIVFGLSRNFALSLLAYMAIGMADQVSVVMRHLTIQLSTPDELRGRVSSVNMLFIGASNQLGAVESGLVAAATSATFAVVSGGAGCLAVVAAVAARMPQLRRYTISPSVAAEAEPRALTAAGEELSGAASIAEGS